MSNIQSVLDRDSLTLTFTAEFDAPPERVWQVWEDPRQLERWWGPPTWPATFKQHELVEGGQSRYFMTGPDGEKGHGWWTISTVEPPNGFEFMNGFADDTGEPDPSMPVTRVTMTLEPLGQDRTRMTVLSTFPGVEQLEQLLGMGMQEGMQLAMGQIDGVLAAA